MNIFDLIIGALVGVVVNKAFTKTETSTAVAHNDSISSSFAADSVSVAASDAIDPYFSVSNPLTSGSAIRGVYRPRGVRAIRGKYVRCDR